MLIAGRAALFLIVTLAVGPGLLANVILKDHWARMRPVDVPQLGGHERFTAWWDPRGPCPENCSFIAGEPSGAFWTLAPAALAPPQWRPVAYAGAILFGVAMGALRMAGGGHFFSDFVFAGVFMFLVVWTALRPDLSLAPDAAHRCRRRAAAGAGGQGTSRGVDGAGAAAAR